MPSGYSSSMSKSRVGERYFKVDPGYDKRVYENTIGNYFVILGAFLIYYACCALLWLTVLVFGMYEPELSTYVCIAIFVFAVIVSPSPTN